MKRGKVIRGGRIVLSFLLTVVVALSIPFVPVTSYSAESTSQDVLLNYSTSWIGNSFPGIGDNGFGEWVQDFIDEIEVVDCAVITASEWDEAGRCTGIYKDGKVNSNLLKVPEQYEEKAWGWGTGSSAVAADSSYIYICNTGNQLLKFKWNPNDIDNWEFQQLVEVNREGKKVIGLTVKDSNLYLVWDDGLIEIRDASTFSKVKEFTVPGAKDLAVDNNNTLWIIAENAIKHYNNDGQELSEVINDVEKPTAVSIDKKDGYLIVCDDGQREQVLFYDVTTTPRLVNTFGIQDGIRAGIPGEIQPLKFFSLKGAGTDAEGNIYVAMSNGESIIRKFTPNGQLIWEVSSHHFIDCATFLPSSDGQEVYGVDEIYTMDYSQSNGKEWRLKAITRDQITYPNDPRLKRDVVCNVWVRELQGRRVMYINGMYCQNSDDKAGLDLYTFEDSPSQIAKYTGSFSDAGWAWDVDSKGLIWVGQSENGKIREYLFLGFDANGKPIYSNNTFNEYDPPALFNKIERIKYFPEKDVMFIAGFTPERPEVEWGLVGSTICRYDNWKAGNRVPTYEIILFSDDLPQAMDIAGDYIFVVGCKSAKVYVYRKSDGTMVGVMAPGPEVGNQSGWVDIPYGIHAVKRSNGEYIILVEEDWRAKNIMYRWTPQENVSVEQPTVAITSPKTGDKFGLSEKIDIKVNASISAGSILKVEFYVNGQKIGEDTNGLDGWSYPWSSERSGVFNIGAKVISEDGVTATSMPVYVYIPVPKGPFGGVASAIPGRIEAENYDGGAEGTAFHAVDTVNPYYLYRMDGIDIDYAKDIDGDYSTILKQGEWVNYTVDVKESAKYFISSRVYSKNGGSLRVKLNGEDLIENMQVPAGDRWITITTPDINIDAGPKILTIICESGEVAINYVEITIPKEPVEINEELSNGLKYEYFEGDWDKLPDFGKLTPVDSGLVPNTDINKAKREDNFGFRYWGYIDIPVDGEYVFYLTSDDGSKLYIDGVEVVDNDGLHGPVDKKGKITLRAGKHSTMITFFEKGGGQVLEAAYEGPGIEKQSIPNSMFYVGANTQPPIIETTPTPPPTPSGKVVPGQIEAEDYDSKNADIGTKDADGGTIVGWLDPGEYFDYKVNVQTAGTYKVEYRVATGNEGAKIELLQDGNVIKTTDIPNNGWGTFTTVDGGNVNLNAGETTLRIRVSGAGFDFNWFKLTLSQESSFEVSSVKATNLSGEVVHKLTQHTFVRVNISVKNNCQEDKSALLIVGLYTPDNQLVNLSAVEKVIKQGKIEQLTAGFNLPDEVNGYKIKAFVWDEWDKMRPLSDVFMLGENNK